MKLKAGQGMRRVILAIVTLVVLCDGAVIAEMTAEQRESIEKAIPASAVKSARPRKLLVVTLDVWDGKVREGHKSIAPANYAIELMGKKTGAYETVFSNDVNMFKPENIGQFDAVCFNNTTGVLFDDPQLKKSLLDFVYSGKGFIGIHAAGATFVQWPEYGHWPAFGEMLGGYEDGGHPWKANETITIKIDDPEHPVNAAFKRSGFEIKDQVFQFRKPWSRDKVRVLISIDTKKTDMDPNRRFLPERQKDLDFPMSWVRDYGRGRVFYTVFGDNPDTFWNPPILKHIFDGIQFALGDLDAPTTPSGKATSAVRNRETLRWRLGVGLYSFKDDPFDKAVEKAASLGVRYVEGGPKFDMSEDEIIRTREMLLAAGVRMVSYYVHKIPSDEKVITQLFEFCRKLGVETIVSELEPQTLDLLEKYCDKYEINLAIHNHTKDVSPFYYDPNNILKVCQGRSKRIGACADIGYWIRAGYDPVETLRKMKDRIISLHIHDLDELGAKGHDVPWGTGAAKIEDFIKEAYKLEIKPTLWTIEYAGDWQDNTRQIAQSVEFFDKVAGPLADYERSYVTRTKGVRRASGVTDEERAKIENAIPKTAPATPKKARRILVFNRNTGYGGHPSIPHATLAIQLMGQKTAAYETVVSDDPNIFKPETLKDFDAIFLNNTVGNLFEEKDLRDSFLDFVNRGGGLLANHASSVAFTNWSTGGEETWPEFAKMLGARGANHREANEKVMVKLDDPTNPLNAAFGGKSFEFTDEFFRFHDVYSRDNCRVLFSIDVAATDMNQGRCYGKCDRADNDYALAWVKSYGKGRVYYTTIGHNPYVFWDPVFLQHFLAAIQFAFGDLDAPTTPSGRRALAWFM
jgi:type 1 glutamine amidotransferase/sugar phosphate isomerase/epimerase